MQGMEKRMVYTKSYMCGHTCSRQFASGLPKHAQRQTLQNQELDLHSSHPVHARTEWQDGNSLRWVRTGHLRQHVLRHLMPTFLLELKPAPHTNSK